MATKINVLRQNHIRKCPAQIKCLLYSIVEEVLEQAGIISIEAMLLETQLRWAGHVSRMEDHRLPKIVLYEELSAGHRNRSTKEEIQRISEEIPVSLPHR